MQKMLRYEKGNPNSFIIVEMHILTTFNFHFLSDFQQSKSLTMFSNGEIMGK